MILSISNFNRIFILIAVALVLLVHLIVFFVYPAPDGIDYHWRNEINKEKPDIIFIGSSPLNRDMDKNRLVGELQSYLNRPLSVLKISEMLTGACYWQLLLKNQVCQSQDRGHRVGIVVTENELTSQAYILNSDGFRKEMIIKQLKSYDDPLHYRKEFPSLREGPVQRILRKWRLYYLRKTISLDMLNAFVKSLYRTIYKTPLNVSGVLNRKFHRGGLSDNFSFDPKNQQSFDFDSSITESYLPDMVALNRDYHLNLFVVILPSRQAPQGTLSMRQKVYYNDLKNYLESNGVKCISFAENQEFQYDDFFDETHLKNPGKLTDLLARELISRGIVK